MKQTFAAFKEEFYGKVKDLSVFDSGEINLLKVVLDGLKVDYASKGKIRVFIFYPAFIRNTFFFLLKIKKTFSGVKKIVTGKSLENLKEKTGKSILIIDPAGRVVFSGDKIISLYFGNIRKVLKEENCFTVLEGTKKMVPENDFQIREYNVHLAVEIGIREKADKELLVSLQTTYNAICDVSVFTENEKLNIRIAFQQFFIMAIFWRKIVSVLKPCKVLLWPHYHREGCILAFREKGIPVIELQHGLIAEEDIFYVLPERVKAIQKRALFADEIWVYGNYWKEQLLKGAGYAPEQIKICGYFPVVSEATEKVIFEYRNFCPGKKIILITTQTSMHEYFCSYIRFLSENLQKRNLPYFIFVKLHPAELPEKYSTLGALENVRIVNESVDVLFSFVDLHVSVYSTTLFDAIRFGVPNFSIYLEPFSDYLESIRKENISRIIQPDENPVDFPDTSTTTRPKEYYYEAFHTSLFQDILAG
jgi:hypothetical protein